MQKSKSRQVPEYWCPSIISFDLIKCYLCSMKINYIEYHDKNVDWHLTKTYFSDLTLLVGASGVGKTRVLDAIYRLKNIARGKGYFGIKWEISFFLSDGQSYLWSGEFQTRQKTERGSEQREPYRLIFEKLILNDQVIAEREYDNVFFNGKPIPKLSNDESLIRLLKEESSIRPIFEGFKKVLFSNAYYEEWVASGKKKGYTPIAVDDEQLDIDEIRKSDLLPFHKFYLASLLEKNVEFNEIRARFREIFPLVEDLKVDIWQESSLGKIPIIKVREKSIKNWIWHGDLSSGMIRTLLHLIELYLSEEGSVVLVDEFENSLGANCIDEVTDIILNPGRKIQYILTSHHPYVINNIDFKHWKVVTRNGGIVTTHDASEFNLGKSRHQRFLQLIQLDAYRTGMAS